MQNASTAAGSTTTKKGQTPPNPEAEPPKHRQGKGSEDVRRSRLGRAATASRPQQAKARDDKHTDRNINSSRSRRTKDAEKQNIKRHCEDEEEERKDSNKAEIHAYNIQNGDSKKENTRNKPPNSSDARRVHTAAGETGNQE